MAKASKAVQEEATEALVAPVHGSAAIAKTFDYGDDAGGGFDQDDKLKIPFLNLLQSNSNPIIRAEAEGLAPGQFFNTVTKEGVDGVKGIAFIPIHTAHCYVEWMGEAGSGTPVAKHAINSAEVVESKDEHFKKTGLKFPDKKHPLMLGENSLVQTYYVYALLLNDDGDESTGVAVMPIASAKIKHYENWISALRLLRVKTPKGGLINPPLIANRCKVQSWDDTQRSTGKPFKNIKFAPFAANKVDSLLDVALPAHELLYNQAKQYAADIKSGALKEDFANQGGEPIDAGEAEEGKPAF